MSEKTPQVRKLRLQRDYRSRSRRGRSPNAALRWTMNFAFLAYLVYIGYLSITNGDSLAMQLGQVRLGSLIDLQHWLSVIAFAGLFVSARFFVLGCLLQSVYHLHKKKTEDDLFSIRRWPVVLVGLGLTAVLCGMRSGQLPAIFTLALPCFGFLFGVWIASNCWRGFRTTIWLVPKVSLLAIVLAGLCGIGVYFATSDEPLAFESLRVSADDKARLIKLIRTSEHLDNGNDRLDLTEKDINHLMALACEQLPIEVKANAQLSNGVVGLKFSLRIPLGEPLDRYINSQGNYRITVKDGNVAFRPVQLRVGRMQLPSFLLGSLGDYAVVMAKVDDRASAIISSIDLIRFTDQRVEAVYNPKSLQRELKRAFRHHLGETPEVLAATTDHARHLVEFAADMPGGEERFTAFLRTAFTFAQERSLKGKDPMDENRAAILALAIVLGHRRVETFVGEVTDNRLKVEAGWVRGQVAIRGRRDWTRHFFVSAGLSLTFNSDVSDGAGLFKEEADSGKGGSGFSFSDLLADRAGVQFAVAATRDREAAQRMQALLANEFSIDDIFPPAADLPEGFPDAAFQEEFGGVDGEEYNQMLAEIDRRLAACRALINK